MHTYTYTHTHTYTHIPAPCLGCKAAHSSGVARRRTRAPPMESLPCCSGSSLRSSCVCVCVCIYIYVSVSENKRERGKERERGTVYIYKHIYMYICVYVCMYVKTYLTKGPQHIHIPSRDYHDILFLIITIRKWHLKDKGGNPFFLCLCLGVSVCVCVCVCVFFSLSLCVYVFNRLLWYCWRRGRRRRVCVWVCACVEQGLALLVVKGWFSVVTGESIVEFHGAVLCVYVCVYVCMCVYVCVCVSVCECEWVDGWVSG